MPSVVVLNGAMLSVTIVNVVMLSVMALEPYFSLSAIAELGKINSPGSRFESQMEWGKMKLK